MSIQTVAKEYSKHHTEQLCIYLLGPPRVTWHDDDLHISRRQTRALLYRLAAHLDFLPREQLCFLLWPDTPNATARTNLSRLLSLLRRALPDPHLMLRQGNRVGLDPGRVWSDTKAWAETLPTLPSNPTAAALQRLTTLYRGPFLSGFSLPDRPEFENWATSERERWERLYLEALAALTKQETVQGMYDEAIIHARRYLEVDELAEEMHRRLIELYATVGERDAALHQFERCVTVLERELGVSPLPETRAAYEAALAGRTIMPTPPAPPSWTILPSLEAPLVGRDEALGHLQQAYTQAYQGRGRMVLISGEPGIGKSRLLQEFTAGLGPTALTIVGGGHEAEQGLPYWPLVEALSPHLPGINWKTLWGGITDLTDLIEVARLLPALRAALPNLPTAAPVEPGQEQASLFRGLCNLILALAARHPPLVLCLDDLHWADEATLSWLGYLGRRIRSAPVLVLGTYRSTEAAAVATLRVNLTRLGTLQELRLEGLNEGNVLHLVRHLSGQKSGGKRFSRRLHRETGGNPFFLLETLRAMFEAGLLRQDKTGWSMAIDKTTEDYNELPLPNTVGQAIRARLDRLSPPVRQVLETAAVLGDQLDLDLVQATSGRQEGEVVDALDTLTARQLLSESKGTYRFDHDLIRTVVYRDLSYGRRRLLHRRAGEMLEKTHPDQTALLARHFDQAEQPDKAVQYLLLAGDRARALYGYKEAIRHYRRALALLKAQGAHMRAARTLMRLGLTHHIAFDFRQARQAYDEGFALWQRTIVMRPAIPRHPAPHPLRVDWPHLLTLDPALAGDANSGGVIDQLFSGLVESNAEMNVVPDVARSWEVLEGGHKYLFHLRDDVHWSDGVPVTAGDFEYAWKRALDPVTDSPCANRLYDVKGARAFHQGSVSDPAAVGVRALNDATLLVELEGPTSYFLHLLDHSITCPVPRHVVETYSKAWTEADNLVTNGPFRLESWQRDRRVVLTRNPEYHGRFTGNVQRVALYLLVTPSAKAAKLEMYEQDGLDIISLWWGSPPAEMERLRQQHAGEHVSAPQLYTRYLGFNTTLAPFDDPQVRQAFAHATDRETLANVLMRGYASPATGGFVPPGMPGHTSGIGLSYDPELARQLLAAAGYPGGRGFPRVDWLTHQGTESLGDYLEAQWQTELGVAITRQTVTWKNYVERIFTQPPQMFLWGCLADYPDPDYFLQLGDHKRLTRWRDETYDALVERARRVMNQEERMKMYREADMRLIAEAPLIPLVYSRRNVLLKPWVRAYPSSAFRWWFWKDVVIDPH